MENSDFLMEDEFELNLYRLLLFYKILIDLLDSFFDGPIMIFEDELNRNYLRLSAKIEDILSMESFKNASIDVNIPFNHLRSLDPDCPECEWQYGGKQICGDSLSDIESYYIKHGEKEYELSIADQEFLSSMMSYLSQYKLQKREENLKFNKKIAKIAEENNPIEKKVSRKDSPSSLNWDILNKKIEKVSKKKFEDGYYADAVESAFKEINFRIKGIVEDVTGRELDGQNLMDVAFAFSRTSGPIIKLADLSKTTGRNIQKGYKNIFSGSIQGIRNPKAHENILISQEEAIHFLFLASLLMFKVDESDVEKNK